MKWFSIKELCKSSTAKKLNIDNTPTAEIEKNLTVLIEECLDPIREKFGNPIMVASGYRCPQLNAACGGSPTSEHCLDQNTEILTNHGWKTYKTISKHDKAFTYNFDTDRIDLQSIKDIIIQDHDGVLYYADNRHIQYAVTSEHRMIVRTPAHKYQRITDKTLSEKEKAYFDSLKTNNDKWHFEFAEDAYRKRRLYKTAGITSSQNTYDVNILRMAMAVIADGFIHWKSGKFGGVGFNLSKERDIAELEDILSLLGWHYIKKYSEQHEKRGSCGVYNYYINSTTAKEIYQIIGSDKKIPYWFLSLSAQTLKSLIITYAKFDGSIDQRPGNHGITIFSKDEENIDMLQAMSVLCGMRCVKKHFKNVEVNIRNTHSVMPHFFNLYITTNTDESRLEEHYKYSKRFYYKGVVWCVRTKNETIITRRNGKVVILGNCQGFAADIDTSDNTRLWEVITSGDFKWTQLINEYPDDDGEPSWIHISYNPDNLKCEKLICKNGIYYKC